MLNSFYYLHKLYIFLYILNIFPNITTSVLMKTLKNYF